MKNIYLFLLSFLLSTQLFAQNPISVGAGSYAEYTPLSKCKTADHTGDQSRLMETRKLYITDASKGLPIPTNDWWTDLIVNQYSGNLWAHPQVVNAEDYGFFIAYPKVWTADGREMKWNSQIQVTGEKFHPVSAAANRWHDWGFDFVMKDNEKEMLVTLAHGVPFTWVESKNMTLELRCTNATYYTASGQIQLPFKGNQFVILIGNDAYGVYAPDSTLFEQKDDVIKVTFAGTQQYLSFGVLPSKDQLQAFGEYAYTIPRKTQVTWDYNETTAKMTSHWNVTTENLRGGTQKNILQGFIPHHYKKSTLDFAFTSYEYATPRGKMKIAAGNSFSISYDFNGILPFFAAPKQDAALKNPYQKDRMKQLISDYADKGGFGADTYWGGKGLTQMALYMTFAHEMGETALFEKCKARLKAALVNWLTYTPGESNFFFARFNRWGGLVGEDTSYDSDTFNDHHFHYGYFTYASSLLALFDEDFKQKYGAMATLLAKDYANWDKTDTQFPFLRNLDPWEGHSYAGGLAGEGGNGQESTSEAMQGWGGLYMLGVATNNKTMRDAGIFGWVTESRGTAEYWFDRDRENIDYTKYDKPYSSNLTSQGVGWWTWFSGDPVWMHSIQWMPISPCLKYLYENIDFAKWDYTQMWTYKQIGGWSTDASVTNALSQQSGLGNVVLSYLQISNPDSAAAVYDTMWNAQMPVAKNPDTGGISYFVTHSHRTYGEICWDIHADIPTATTYKTAAGKYTYVVYNPNATEQTVHFYKSNSQIIQFKAPANQLTVYSETPVAQKIQIASPQSTVIEPTKTLQLSAVLLDQYGAIIDGSISWSVNQGGTVSNTGLFTAGASKTTATITAQSGSLSTTLILKIDDKPVLTSAQLLPVIQYLEVGKTVSFSLKMLDQYSSVYHTNVTWQILKNGVQLKSDSVFDLQNIGIYTINAIADGKTYSTQLYLSPAFTNIALNKTATGSSSENVGMPASYATDGSLTTRWGSAHADPQWIYVDLGAVSYVSYVSLIWEAAYGSLYDIQVSNDLANWTTVNTITGMGGTERIDVNQSARYVRMYGKQRGTTYGYSLYEFEVYGVAPMGTTPTLFGIDMSPHSGTLKEGQSVQLQVIGYDQFGNTMTVNPIYSILSGTGTITQQGVFTPTKYGTAVVQAKVNNQTAKVNFLIEETVKLASVVISPKKAQLIKGQSQTFSCVAKDQFGAPFATEALNYALAGNAGTLNGATFTGTAVDSAKIIVSATGATPRDTASVKVLELAQTNLAYLKPVIASSAENAGTLATSVNDGSLATRWGSAFSDPQSIEIDLQNNFVINTVKLFWQTSYATSYRIETSLDEETWTTVYTKTNATGVNNTITIAPTAARYVRIVCLSRNSAYGSSLWEMEVYGTNFWANPQATTIKLNPDPLVAYVGQNVQITASLFDQYNLAFTTNNNFSWSITGGGTIDVNGKLTPSVAGDYVLTVQNGSLSKQFPIKIFAAKQLSRLEVTPTYSLIKTNEQLQLSVKGFDQYGNEITVSPTWTTTGGTISATGLFSSSVNGIFNVTATVGSLSVVSQIQVITAGATNIALNKPTTTSSGTGSAAVDGNTGTRWESAFQDGPEWLLVDLGDAYQLTDAQIVWENASAQEYQIQISTDKVSWITIKAASGLTGARTDVWRLSGIGRYVRIWCTKRSTVWGYSIFELRLYGLLMQAGQPYTIKLTNPKTNLLVGEQTQYLTVVYDKTGAMIANPPLSWSVTGVGTISSNGTFVSYFSGSSTVNVLSQQALISTAVIVSDLNSAVDENYASTTRIWATRNQVYIAGTQINTVTITDCSGRVVYNSTYNGIDQLEINLPQSNGFFIIQVVGNDSNVTRKILM